MFLYAKAYTVIFKLSGVLLKTNYICKAIKQILYNTLIFQFACYLLNKYPSSQSTVESSVISLNMTSMLNFYADQIPTEITQRY